MGAALSISALPVIARILMDLDLLKTPIGKYIMGVSTINDVVGWLLFTVVLSMSGLGSSTIPLWIVIVATLAAVIGAITILPKFFEGLFAFGLRYLGKHSPFWMMMVSMFVFAAIAEYLGIHAIFGSFVLGIALNGSRLFNESMKHAVEYMTQEIFAPLFFVTVGLKVNFFKSFQIIPVSVILVVSYVSKLLA